MIKQSLLLSAGILLAASPVHAQDNNESGLDQIIVTGARSPVTISQVCSATTVIGREEIERRQVRYVSDLLRAVPGFSVSHSGVIGSQTQVRVRGAEANHVLVLIDGVRANDPATGDEFRWEHLTTGNIERIEIVRGAQSSLWGSDAVAAVVHVITRGTGSAPALNAYAEGGSFSTINAGANGRTSGDRWSLNGGIEYLDTDGQNISRTGDEKDGSDNTTVSVAGSVDATDALSFTGGLRYTDAYSQFDPTDFFVTGLPTDGDVATASDNLYADVGGSLETLNGKVTEQENNFAAKVAAGMKLSATGGSDAHAVSDVGKYATCFHRALENEWDLVTALKSGEFEPVKYRQKMGDRHAG